MRTQTPSVLDPDYFSKKRVGDYCALKDVPGLLTRHREELIFKSSSPHPVVINALIGLLEKILNGCHDHLFGLVAVGKRRGFKPGHRVGSKDAEN